MANISNGRVLVQRYFDVAEEIDMRRAMTELVARHYEPAYVEWKSRLHLVSAPLELTLENPNSFAALACTISMAFINA